MARRLRNSPARVAASSGRCTSNPWFSAWICSYSKCACFKQYRLVNFRKPLHAQNRPAGQKHRPCQFLHLLPISYVAPLRATGCRNTIEPGAVWPRPLQAWVLTANVGLRRNSWGFPARHDCTEAPINHWLRAERWRWLARWCII